eukprot:gene13026-8872_t
MGYCMLVCRVCMVYMDTCEFTFNLVIIACCLVGVFSRLPFISGFPSVLINLFSFDFYVAFGGLLLSVYVCELFVLCAVTVDILWLMLFRDMDVIDFCLGFVVGEYFGLLYVCVGVAFRLYAVDCLLFTLCDGYDGFDGVGLLLDAVYMLVTPDLLSDELLDNGIVVALLFECGGCFLFCLLIDVSVIYVSRVNLAYARCILYLLFMLNLFWSWCRRVQGAVRALVFDGGTRFLYITINCVLLVYCCFIWNEKPNCKFELQKLAMWQVIVNSGAELAFIVTSSIERLRLWGEGVKVFICMDFNDALYFHRYVTMTYERAAGLRVIVLHNVCSCLDCVLRKVGIGCCLRVCGLKVVDSMGDVVIYMEHVALHVCAYGLRLWFILEVLWVTQELWVVVFRYRLCGVISDYVTTPVLGCVTGNLYLEVCPFDAGRSCEYTLIDWGVRIVIIK